MFRTPRHENSKPGRKCSLAVEVILGRFPVSDCEAGRYVDGVIVTGFVSF